MHIDFKWVLGLILNIARHMAVWFYVEHVPHLTSKQRGNKINHSVGLYSRGLQRAGLQEAGLRLYGVGGEAGTVASVCSKPLELPGFGFDDLLSCIWFPCTGCLSSCSCLPRGLSILSHTRPVFVRP